jgi:hypothetical protein
MTNCGKDRLSDTCAKYYSPTENLAVKITVLLKAE